MVVIRSGLEDVLAKFPEYLQPLTQYANGQRQKVQEVNMRTIATLVADHTEVTPLSGGSYSRDTRLAIPFQICVSTVE